MRIISLIAAALLLSAACGRPSPDRTGGPAPVDAPSSGRVSSSADRGAVAPAPAQLGVEKVGGQRQRAAAAWNAKGLNALKRGRTEEAERLLARSLALDPSSPTTAYNTACVHALEGRTERAASLLVLALAGNLSRYGAQMDQDQDLASLRRAGAPWTTAVEARVSSTERWSKALSEAGAFVLLSRSRLVSLFGAPAQHDDSRGDLYFVHADTARLLPLVTDGTVTGFLVTGSAGQRRVTTLSWRGTAGETDVDPERYSGVHVAELSLKTLSAQRARIRGHVVDAALVATGQGVVAVVSTWEPAGASRQDHVFELSGGRLVEVSPPPAGLAAEGRIGLDIGARLPGPGTCVDGGSQICALAGSAGATDTLVLRHAGQRDRVIASETLVLQMLGVW